MGFRGAGWACPAYDTAAAPALGYHVSRARADPAARHPAGVDAVGAGWAPCPVGRRSVPCCRGGTFVLASQSLPDELSPEGEQIGVELATGAG